MHIINFPGSWGALWAASGKVVGQQKGNRPMKSFTRGLKHALQPSNLIVNLALLLIAAICLLPMIWAVSASLKDRNELYMATPTLLPQNPTLANYTWMLSQSDMS